VIRNGITRPGTPLHGVRVDEVTPMGVRGWLTALSTPWEDEGGKRHPGYGPSSRVKAYRVLSLILKAAALEGLREGNPAEGITPVPKGMKAQARRQHYFLYLSEIARIIAAAEYVPQRGHEDWGLFFEVLAWSGCRPQEIRALWPRQVHPEAGFILVDAAISDGSTKTDMQRLGTKGGRERLAYLPSPVMARLKERCEGRDPEQLIFPGEDGRSFVWASTYKTRGWVPMLGVAGVGPDPGSFLKGRRQAPWVYDLRAALISHLRSAGVPQVDIGAQVGHQDQTTTDLYTVVTAAGLEDPISVAARKATDLTRRGVIEYLYSEAQKTLR
jgi:integrase